jgi:hypothetical protein
MNFFDFLSVAIILTVFSFVFYLLYIKTNIDQDKTNDIVKSYSDTVKEITTTFIEEIGKIEKSHFEQVEKQSTKQLQILERQTKDFIGVMETFIESQKPPAQPNQVVSFLDKLPERENTIEKEEIEEHSLEDIPRIPITDGIGVQFEGEEEIHPINIT